MDEPFDAVTGGILARALSQDAPYPKALANYMFREIIEDAHTKYNISQEDMKAMCKQAVNRAALYISMLEQKDALLEKAFCIFAIDGLKWDSPEVTDDVLEKKQLLTDCRNVLKYMSDNIEGFKL